MPLKDITLPLHEEMAMYPGDPPFETGPHYRIAGGDSCNVTAIRLGTHTGTHIDPPVHFFQGGAAIDSFPADLMVCRALVIDATGREEIDCAAMSAVTDFPAAVLFKTGLGGLLAKGRTPERSAWLTPETAQRLSAQGVRLVGIESLSVDAPDSEEAHKVLLGRGVFILEGVNLSDIPAGICRLYCFPLRIRRGDGGPARVMVELTPQ
jgi:arylformamidase